MYYGYVAAIRRIMGFISSTVLFVCSYCPMHLLLQVCICIGILCGFAVGKGLAPSWRCVTQEVFGHVS